MKKTTIIAAFLGLFIIGLNSCKKDKAASLGTTRKFDITSVETGTTYTITAFYPDSEFPTTPVPVVYVLDGFWWKDMAAEVLTELSEKNEIPKCLLISLDYKKGDGVYARSHDLVYPGEGTEDKSAGQNFFKFLKTELVPKVDADYTCDTTQRVLFGHSLGGLFVLYSLLDNATNPLFKKCIAASCSIGMGVDNYVFEKEIEVAAQQTDLPVSLFIGTGSYVGSSPAMHQEFYNRIKSRGYPNLKVAFETYPAEHGTDPYPSFKNGISFVLSH